MRLRVDHTAPPAATLSSKNEALFHLPRTGARHFESPLGFSTSLKWNVELNFRIQTYVSSFHALQRTAWEGNRRRCSFETSFDELGRAAVLSSVAARPADDAFRVEGEMRAAQLASAFTFKKGRVPLLNWSYIEALRDFTRAGRTGDFGQAVGFLVCLRALNFRFIVDYEQFCRAVGRPAVKGRRPDYVAFNSPEDSTFAVVECKGRLPSDTSSSTPAAWKAALFDAYEQTKAGFEHLASSRYLPSRGIDRLISVLALGQGKGATVGIKAQVMQKSEVVEPWELNASQRRALRRLAYGMWGTMAGGSALGKTLGSAKPFSAHHDGSVHVVEGIEYWVPDFEAGCRSSPFALMAEVLPLSTIGMSQPRHGIQRDTLRSLSGPSEMQSAVRDYTVTKVQGNTVAHNYGDGTALFDGQATHRLYARSLSEFMRG